MKKTCNSKPGTRRPCTTRVHVEFHHPTAQRIAIAGTFNDWRPEATPLVPLGEGRWIKELVLPAGTYEYRLVVDGQWMPDPQAAVNIPNPFGGLNSVLQVDASAHGGNRQR